MRPIVLIALSLMLSSCGGLFNPETFRMNEYTLEELYGRILSPIDSVEKKSSRELLIHSGGRASLRNTRETQFEMTFFAKVLTGEGALFRMRAVPVEYTLTPSILLRYTTQGCTVEEDGKIIARNDTLRATPGVADRIIFTNDAGYLTIMVGCTKLFEHKVQLPGTEFLIVESLPSSELLLSQFAMRPTVDK